MPKNPRNKLRGRDRQRGEWATLWTAFGLLIATGVGVWLLATGQMATLLGIKEKRYLNIPPLPEMVQEGYQPLSREQAIAANAALAVSSAPVERANPFVLRGAQGTALNCLTAAIYYEAANEPDVGQRAVAQVILNRMRHPAFPKSVCGVVFQGSERKTGCQFSFTCDGSLNRTPSTGGWARARGAAFMALSGFVEPTVGTATHYHAYYVMPYWAPKLDKITTIGAHIFYRWKGYWGQRAAFTGRYNGVEQIPVKPIASPTPGTEGAVPAPALAEDALGGVPGAGAATPKLINPVEQDRNAAKLEVQHAGSPLQADEEKGQLHIDGNSGVLEPPLPKP